METLSGNRADKESFPKTVRAFCQLLKAEQTVYFVVDSAPYSAKNLQTLGETRWLTRVPETVAEAKRLLAEADADEMRELPDAYAYLEVPSDYGGIAQRWLVVYSPIAAQREEKTLLRRVEKEEKAAQKAYRHRKSALTHCP
jgi:transposase